MCTSKLQTVFSICHFEFVSHGPLVQGNHTHTHVVVVGVVVVGQDLHMAAEESGQVRAPRTETQPRSAMCTTLQCGSGMLCPNVASNCVCKEDLCEAKEPDITVFPRQLVVSLVNAITPRQINKRQWQLFAC